MSNAPILRKFKAVINLMPGSPSKVIVVGEVETRGGAYQPHLENRGVNGTTLKLDLTIRNTGGIGDQAFLFRPARYESPATQGQYTQTEVFWEDEVLLCFDVTEAH